MTVPGAVVDTVRFLSKNPNLKFPWYLDHVEIHRVGGCEDPQPLKIPIESDATLLDMNPELTLEVSSQVAGSVFTQSQTEGTGSASKHNSPDEGTIENMSGIFSNLDLNGVQSALDNEAAASRFDELGQGSESEFVSDNSQVSDSQSAPARLETPTPELEGDVLTWKLWPILQIPTPISVRFVTNYHKKRILPVQI
ncbi:hypothetical protein TWF718_002421 [Orbilia javanica]|uniref:Uncharacterized protein n=1 Tax=Orbilia javanica TaxID=47235 RepID=A0AAN8MNE2_9PEZI